MYSGKFYSNYFTKIQCFFLFSCIKCLQIKLHARTASMFLKLLQFNPKYQLLNSVRFKMVKLLNNI